MKRGTGLILFLVVAVLLVSFVSADFSDDFGDGNYADKWAITENITVEESSGNLSYAPTTYGVNAFIYTKQEFTPPYDFQWTAADVPYGFHSFLLGVDKGLSNDPLLVIMRKSDGWLAPFRYSGGAWQPMPGQPAGGQPIQSGDYFVVKVNEAGDRVDILKNTQSGTPVATINLDWKISTGSVGFFTFFLDSAGAVDDVKIVEEDVGEQECISDDACLSETEFYCGDNENTCSTTTNYICESGSCVESQSTGECAIEPCPNGCENGACIPGNTTAICKDSDGGKNYFEKGTTIGRNNGTGIINDTISRTDFCIKPKFRRANWVCYDGLSESQGVETSCKPSEVWRGYAQDFCEGRCNDETGKCGVNSFGVQEECDSKEGLLTEYYCSNNQVASLSYDCPNGCSDGACIGGEICVPNYVCTVKPSVCPVNGAQVRVCEDVECGADGYKEEIKCDPGVCSGCLMPSTGSGESNCVPYGIRTRGQYCDIDGDFKIQRVKDAQGNWASCQNNYECDSNLCSGGECIEINDIIQESSRLKSVLAGVICFIANPFDESERVACVAELLDYEEGSSSGGGSSGGSGGP